MCLDLASWGLAAIGAGFDPVGNNAFNAMAENDWFVQAQALLWVVVPCPTKPEPIGELQCVRFDGPE